MLLPSIPPSWVLLAVPPLALFFFLVRSVLLPTVLPFLQPAYSPTTQYTNDFPTKPRDPWLGSFAFFRSGLAYLTNIREEGGHRGFWIFGHRVVMVRGLAGRDVFFSKGLDFMAGYRLLNPQLVDIMPTTEIKGDESWASFMATFLRSEVLERLTPTMVQDVVGTIESWGDSGTVDPFDQVYEIVFLLSMRLATCTEWCSDRTKVRALMRIFDRLEAGSTPSSLILSWIPTPARLGRLLGGAELYKMISDVVIARKREGRREDDPLQVLIDRGFGLTEITRFIAMTLFAAVTNTGNVFCWFLIYISLHPEWKQQIQAEVDAFLEAHSSTSPSSTSHHTLHSISDALARAGPDGLDEGTPTLDATLHETLRVRFNGFLMRRNTGAALPLRGTTTSVAPGAFLFFPTADLHFDDALYARPHAFDPAHFAPAAVEARKEHGITFLGWGAARHTCVGRKAALTMMKMITVVVLGAFETDVVDAQGREVGAVPASKDDMLFKVPRTKEKVFLKYRVRKLGR